MRHRRMTNRLGRTTSHRLAMLKNMVTSLFKYERLVTTDRKAKELKSLADNIITLAKRGDLHARRQALSAIRDKKIVKKIFEEYPARYHKRDGGYSRVIKIGTRRGDGASTSVIELIPAEGIKKPKKRGLGGRRKDTASQDAATSKDTKDVKKRG